MTLQQRERTRYIFTFFIGLEVLIGVVAILLDGFELEALHTATRFSGRLSLLFFSIMLLTRKSKPLSDQYASENPFLLFAILHGIHLVQLLFFVTLSEHPLIPYRLLGGFVAYLLIFAMPIFRRLNEQAKLSDIFYRRVWLIYFPYLWVIFFMSYLPRIMKKMPYVGGSYWEFVVLFVWVIALGVVGFFFNRKLVPARYA